MKYIYSSILLFVFTCFLAMPSVAQNHEQANYDQSKVPDYTLPNPLVLQNGNEVTNSEIWKEKRRPEILHLFETEIYGKSPNAPQSMHFEVTSEDTTLFGGIATRKQVSIYFTSNKDRPRMDLLIYIPNKSKPVPAFLGLNFNGNQAIYPDPGIKITDQWVRDGNHKATEDSRGTSQGSWPVEAILSRGYALVTAYYGDLDPDYDDGFKNGIHPLFYGKNQSQPAEDEWGAIGAWAWGLSRAEDYLESDKDINASKVAVMGLSRLAKTALWAGAQDQRFSLVVSNSSGAGGAALSRRQFGETVKRINTSFPHWFNDNFNKYNDNESALPIDQHELIALIAPRPVYVQTSTQDLWADPHGQFLACKFASPVYNLLGVKGLDIDHMPGVNQPIMEGNIAFHERVGKHMITLYDWERYMDFADKYLKE